MVDRKQIQVFCNAVAREFRPLKIILFGSHAYGNPTDDSDVDLLVIMPFKGPGANQAVKILGRVEPPFPLDLLVRQPATVARRVAWGDFFLREVLDRGEVLYEASHA